MLDDLASALVYFRDQVFAAVQRITWQDVEVLSISFIVAATFVALRELTPIAVSWSHSKIVSSIRNYIEGLFRTYAFRFRTRGFRFVTCKYALWLAFGLWLHAFFVLTLWPTWIGLGIVLLSALAVLLTLSILGFRTRGPRGTIWRFGIFYEPSFAMVSTFLIGKLPDLAGRAIARIGGYVTALWL